MPDFHPKNFSSLKARFQNSMAPSTKSGVTLGSELSHMSNQIIEPKKLTKNEMKELQKFSNNRELY